MCSFVRNHVKLEVSLSWRWGEMMVRLVVVEVVVDGDVAENFWDQIGGGLCPN